MKKNPDHIQYGSFSTLVSTPWKNGAGTTKQICIEPKEASFENNDFLWRLSTAQIHQESDFSLFPGMNRLLSVIEGKELTIQSEMENTLLRFGEVFAFSGSEKIHCTIPKGEIQDLGLIFKEEKVKAKMNLVEFGSKPRSFQLDAKQIFVINISGELNISVYPGEYNYTLKKQEFLKITKRDGEDNIILCAAKASSTATIAVELDF